MKDPLHILANVQHSQFTHFTDMSNKLTNILNKKFRKLENTQDYKQIENIVNKLYILNQELYSLQDKYEEFIYNVLESESLTLNEDEKEILSEYSDWKEIYPDVKNFISQRYIMQRFYDKKN